MGSTSFAGEDVSQSQPSTSNGRSCKLSRTLLDGCDAVNHASIPKKLRSAIKKRGRESITSPLHMSRKQTTVDTLKKDGAKKSKLNMKQGRHITKDEEEVAETLYALAGFFFNANKADHQPGLDDEKPEIKSSATVEEGSSMNAAPGACPTPQEETVKMSSKVTLKAAFLSSNLVNSTAEEVKSRTLEDPQPECFSSKQAETPNAYGCQSELSPCSRSRPLASMLDMNQNGEQEIHMDQVTASGYGKNCSSIGDKYKDSFVSPTGAMSSEMQKPCTRIHSLFESTNSSSQPHAIEHKKQTTVAPESTTSWKRCSAHVYISRLIKVLQISDGKEESLLQPTCEGAEQSNMSIRNQMPKTNYRNGDAYFSSIDPLAAEKDSSDIQKDKRPIQDQQMASALSSAKQGYDFLSLGTELCGLDNSKSANGAGCFRERPQQFHMPYLQSQIHSPMLCSLPQNGYSSSFHGRNPALQMQQVQHPQYYSSSSRQQMELQQQKWAQPDWRNGGVNSSSMLNYAHSLFPHLHAALGSKYQQLSPSQHQQQQQLMPLNSNISRLHHNRFERSATVFRPENMAQLQLQLPCNQHL